MACCYYYVYMSKMDSQWAQSAYTSLIHTSATSHVNILSIFFSSQEAAWTISNITAGQSHQIQCVVDYGLLPAVIDIVIKVNHDSS